MPDRSVHLVLASASPRRAELLQQLGYRFDVMPADIDETVRADETPHAYVLRMAQEKGARVATQLETDADPVVIAADTIVVLDGQILGKPRSAEHALQMLLRLSGREHEVMTGVCVRRGVRQQTRCVTTRVTFRPITAVEARQYWASGEPRDKAGGYGIQGIGGIFAEKIDGSYTAVVGLPLAELEALLGAVGVDCWTLRQSP